MGGEKKKELKTDNSRKVRLRMGEGEEKESGCGREMDENQQFILFHFLKQEKHERV